MQAATQLLRVGWDLDGVIARTEEPVLAEFVRRGLIPPGTTIEAVTSFNYSDCFPGVTKEIQREVFEQNAGEVFRIAPYDAGGLHCLNILTHFGIETHIITHRPWEHARRATSEWLFNVEASYSSLHFVADPQEKAAYCEQLGLDMFVEDKLETAELLIPFVRVSMLYDRPYNRFQVEPGGLRWGPVRDIRRFYRFAEVLRFFDLEEHAND